jgi:HSP20 family molecular chaperone IbpA
MVITAKLPVVSNTDVELSRAGDEGEKRVETEHKNGDATYVQRRFGAFARAVRLRGALAGGPVDGDKFCRPW